MSNFLDNLASRSLKLVPVVQPRLASRFEPPPFAPRLPSAASFEDAEAERSVEGEAPSARPEARPAETRVVEYKRTVPIPRTDAPREERAGGEGEATPAPQQNPPQRAADAARVPVRPIETRAHSAQTNASAAAPHAEPPASSFKEGAQAREDVRSGALKGEDESALDSRIRRLMANRLNAGVGNVATGGAPAAQQHAQRERESRETPEKTQTIRVTIGRIDVRAVTTPATEQRRAPSRPAPQLSLADYLKQRGGGGRR